MDTPKEILIAYYNEINQDKRLNDIKGGLIDLDKGHYRWASVSDYYQNIVDMELEKLKKK